VLKDKDLEFANSIRRFFDTSGLGVSTDVAIGVPGATAGVF
jgi:hypothetical protein